MASVRGERFASDEHKNVVVADINVIGSLRLTRSLPAGKVPSRSFGVAARPGSERTLRYPEPLRNLLR